jgi:hypothetical protein
LDSGFGFRIWFQDLVSGSGFRTRFQNPAIRYRRAGLRFSRLREILVQQAAIVAANRSPCKSKGFSYGLTQSKAGHKPVQKATQ